MLLRKTNNDSKITAAHIQAIKYLANSRDTFVRFFFKLHGDLPCFVLFSSDQILDNFSLILKAIFRLHIDKTYDIGIYHVTTISYT